MAEQKTNVMRLLEQKKIAYKDEILTFLTSIMRNEELGEKDRIGAAFKLGRYLGLEGKAGVVHPQLLQGVLYVFVFFTL